MTNRQRQWTLEEDELLKEIAQDKENDWQEVARILRVSGFSRRYASDCRSRWRFLAKSKKSYWDFQHTRQLFRLHSKHGNEWELIAQEFSRSFETDCPDTLFLKFQLICRSYLRTANIVLQGSIYKRLFSPIPIETLMCHILQQLPEDVDKPVFRLRSDEVPAYCQLELKLFQFSRPLTTDNLEFLQQELFNLMNLIKELKIDRSIHRRTRLPPYDVVRKKLSEQISQLRFMLTRLAYINEIRVQSVLPSLNLCKMPPLPAVNPPRPTVIRVVETTEIQEKQVESQTNDITHLLEEKPFLPFQMQVQKSREPEYQPLMDNDSNMLSLEDNSRLGTLRCSNISVQSYGSTDNLWQF